MDISWPFYETFMSLNSVTSQQKSVKSPTSSLPSWHSPVGMDSCVFALSTLSADGHFKRIQPKGDVPSSRSALNSWSYKKRVFCFGGWLVADKIDHSRPYNYHKVVNQRLYYTNDVYMFDTKTATWSRPVIRGNGPSPRIHAAIAQVDHRVFLHGGEDYEREVCRDFFMLNMETMRWTKMRNAGFPYGLWLHSLNGVSLSQLFLVGGSPGRISLYNANFDSISKEVAMFDITNGGWSKEPNLPSVFGGNQGGLKKQRTFQVWNETAVTVISIGGHTHRYLNKRYSNYMIMFEFSAEN